MLTRKILLTFKTEQTYVTRLKLNGQNLSWNSQESFKYLFIWLYLSSIPQTKPSLNKRRVGMFISMLLFETRWDDTLWSRTPFLDLTDPSDTSLEHTGGTTCIHTVLCTPALPFVRLHDQTYCHVLNLIPIQPHFIIMWVRNTKLEN